MNLIVLGPAGSGKSTFVKSFSGYLKDKDYDVKSVNLDSASDPIFEATADIREFVRAEDVMREYRLGINGALIKSMEIAVESIDNILVEGEFVLYDTPGQMELFLYSKEGLRIVEKIS
ncbi:MAG TPA: GTPase, partial [Archaeoglobaceae archaeon]|nr:GTPase [Archaeoglobaceae archaeon]